MIREVTKTQQMLSVVYQALLNPSCANNNSMGIQVTVAWPSHVTSYGRKLTIVIVYVVDKNNRVILNCQPRISI